MFIETLEFTIPVDLCDLFSTLKDGPRSNMEFPASVNSYGTTQDASIQVALRANKLTFVVDGVSSNASMISKSECKTLRLSVFDVDRTLIAQECVTSQSVMSMEPPSPVSLPSKRARDFPVSQSPRVKSSRTSYSESSPVRSPSMNSSQSQIKPRPSNHTQSKPQSDRVNVKQEPEDPDLIEIEPDPEPDDIVPKKEAPFMQIDYSSDVPHTQTSQAALDRVSFPSRSQSSSFHQNVPHVPDYRQSGQGHHGDQNADDFLVFQDDNDYGDNDNSADYSNDDFQGFRWPGGGDQNWNFVNQGPQSVSGAVGSGGDKISHDTRLFPNMDYRKIFDKLNLTLSCGQGQGGYPCQFCDKVFVHASSRRSHVVSFHERRSFACVCGRVYSYRTSLIHHRKVCPQCVLPTGQQE